MFLPIGDDDVRTKIPFVNYAFIAANVLVYLLVTARLDVFELHSFAQEWGTIPSDFRFYNLITAAFIHGGFFHLLGNMWFLWIFGDNVEDRMGHFAYPVFYIAGAISSDLAYIMFNAGSNTPAIGASGAVSAVLGAYMVMLPKVKVRIFYWIYYRAGVFSISSVFAIGFWLLLQLFYMFSLEGSGMGGVAYSAHFGGAIFGIVAGIIAAAIIKSLDKMKIEQLDLQKEEKKSVYGEKPGTVKSVYTLGIEQEKRVSIPPPPRHRYSGPMPLTHNYVDDAKEAVSKLLEAGKEGEAVKEYLAFVRKFRYAALSPMDQLRMGDILLTRDEYRLAEEAYDRFLRYYPEDRYSNDVRFNLAMLCSHYTNNYQKAKRIFNNLLHITGDSERKQAIEEELRKIEEHYERTRPDIPASEETDGAGTGKYAIFRQSSGRINIPEVGRVVADIVKKPLADVTTSLFTCSGFIADSLGENEAEVIARELQNMKVPVFMVKMENIIKLPEAVTVQDATFNADGFKLLATEQEDTIPWNRIRLINAAILQTSRNKEILVDAADHPGRRTAFGFGPRRKKTSTIREVNKRLLIDVVAVEPWQRFRIQEGYTTFSLLGENLHPSIQQNFEFLAQEASRFSKYCLLGEGLIALSQHSNMSAYIYENRRKFDLVNFWLLHRAIYDTPD